MQALNCPIDPLINPLILSVIMIRAPIHTFNLPERFAVRLRPELSAIETEHVPVCKSLLQSSACMTKTSELSLAMDSCFLV